MAYTSKNPLNSATAILAVLLFSLSPAAAQTDTLDDLFAQLEVSNETNWQPIERKIWREWRRSGSAAMDLLMKRGRDALEAGNHREAIQHFSALIDHAPDFAEAYNARATAFFAAERLGLSVADIRQTLALNPRHFGALSGFGMILERTGRDKDALEVYRAVLDIHPHRPDVIDAVARLEQKLQGQAL